MDTQVILRVTLATFPGHAGNEARETSPTAWPGNKATVADIQLAVRVYLTGIRVFF